jgi:hypothetical protein
MDQAFWLPARLPRPAWRARVTAADFADATVMGGPQSRLLHPRVQPEIAHQLLRVVEPVDIVDATTSAATVRFTPVIVINFLTAGSAPKPSFGGLVQLRSEQDWS